MRITCFWKPKLTVYPPSIKANIFKSPLKCISLLLPKKYNSRIQVENLSKPWQSRTWCNCYDWHGAWLHFIITWLVVVPTANRTIAIHCRLESFLFRNSLQHEVKQTNLSINNNTTSLLKQIPNQKTVTKALRFCVAWKKK